MLRKNQLKELDRLYRKAEELIAAGKFREAEKVYREAQSIRSNPGVWGLMAWCLMQAGEFKEGLEAAKKMRNTALKLRSRPLLAIADCLMGRIHHEAGRRVLAEKYYRESLDAQPRAENCIFLGSLLNELGRSIEAKMSYQRALQIDPQNPEARYNLAMWYKRHDDYERTVKHLQMVVELYPGYADAVAQLAMALWRFGSTGLQMARDLLEESLAQDPQNMDKHLLLALTFRIMGKNKDAERQFRFITESLPPDSRACLLFAHFLAEKARRHSEAENLFRRAIELDPEYGPAYYYYGQFLIRNDCMEEATEVLTRAAELGFEKAGMLLETVIPLEEYPSKQT